MLRAESRLFCLLDLQITVAIPLSEHAMKVKMPFSFFPALMLSAIALTGCATHNQTIELYGSPQPPSPYGRTIVIAPDTRYVNVTGGETVNFVVGSKTFAWNFFVAR